MNARATNGYCIVGQDTAGQRDRGAVVSRLLRG
jgi:hypothetical protein